MAPRKRSMHFLLRDNKRNITLKLEGFFGSYGNSSLPAVLGFKPPEPKVYDPQGALSYVITVLLFYGFSIVFIIILLIKKKEDSREIDKEVQEYHKALINVDRQCKKERKDSVRRKTLRRSLNRSENDNTTKGEVTYTRLQGDIDMDTSCASLPTATPGTSRATSFRTPGSTTPPSPPGLSVKFSGVDGSGFQNIELEKKLMQLTWISETSLDKTSELEGAAETTESGRSTEVDKATTEVTPGIDRSAPTRRTIRRSAKFHPGVAVRAVDRSDTESGSPKRKERKRSVTGSIQLHYMPGSYYSQDSSSDSSLVDSDTDTLSELSHISEESESTEHYEYDDLAVSNASSRF